MWISIRINNDKDKDKDCNSVLSNTFRIIIPIISDVLLVDTQIYIVQLESQYFSDVVKMFQKQEIKVSGTCLQKFEPVKEAFQENFNLGEELSAQLCIVYKGKIVSFRIYNMVNKNSTNQGYILI